MPVQWDVTGASAAGDITISAPGAISTEVHCGQVSRGIAPWIVVAFSPAPAHWRSSSTSGNLPALHPLQPSDVLVAAISADANVVEAVFPDRPTLIQVRLDPSDLTSAPMALETLDALVLTPDELRSIPPASQQSLLAQGTSLAVVGGKEPGSLLPWRRSSRGWIASAGLFLPPAINPDAYGPAQGWNPGRSAEFRRRVVLCGAVYCIIFAAICLWRSRWMPIAAVLFSVIAVPTFIAAFRRESPIAQRVGQVRVGDQIVDRWYFAVSPCPAQFRQPVRGSLQPIFYDENQLDAANPVLECDSAGQPTFIDAQLSSDEPIALMTRRWQSNARPAELDLAITTPLRLLQRQSIYPGYIAAGQLPAALLDLPADVAWPGLALTRVSATKP